MWRGQTGILTELVSLASASQPIKMIYELTKPTDHLVPHVPIINAHSSPSRNTHMALSTWMNQPPQHYTQQSPLRLVSSFLLGKINSFSWGGELPKGTKKKNSVRKKKKKIGIVTVDRSINQLSRHSYSLPRISLLFGLCLAAPMTKTVNRRMNSLIAICSSFCKYLKKKKKKRKKNLCGCVERERIY
jgi:hypothetical protein